MSLLFDENLSWRLSKLLTDTYPNSQHVNSLGLERAPDDKIWERAKTLGLAIVSKDDDFRQRALVYGAPPKIIWVRLGNSSTDEIEHELRVQADAVKTFLANADKSVLVLQAT